MFTPRAFHFFLGFLCSHSALKADTENFDRTSLGNLVSSEWFETSTQASQNLFQVVNGRGIGGSRAIQAEPPIRRIRSVYRMINQAGVAGNSSYRVSSKFQISINDQQPSDPNHAIIGVTLRRNNNGGPGLTFSLVRRGNGTRLGINGIGNSAGQFQPWHVEGFETNSEIGLPNNLVNTPATSGWFELSLTITPTNTFDGVGRPLWNVLGELINEAGESVVSVEVRNRPITDNNNTPEDPSASPAFVPGDTIYGGVAVPFVGSSTRRVFQSGRVTAVAFDDFCLEAPTPPIPLLPPHAVTTDPAGSDLDGSGLPDIWESLFQARGLNPSADSDGDGQTNAEEAAFGTNPFDPQSAFRLRINSSANSNVTAAWTFLPDRPGALESSTDLGALNPWTDFGGSPSLRNGEWTLNMPTEEAARFFRVRNVANDLDRDGIPDWLESQFGFLAGVGNENSAGPPRSFDTTGDGIADITLSGDLAAFNEIYRRSEPGTAMTRAQAARLLIQSTFGPTTVTEVDRTASIGAEAWIDEQISLPATFTRPYIEAIDADFAIGATDPSLRSFALRGYHVNNQNASGVSGRNFDTTWMRTAIGAEDQLRQRVAFALSQILVASRSGAGLPNQPRAAATYYDNFIAKAFGNYEDILLDVTLSPYMGTYLSHLRNQVADPSINRFPDENYAREVMQLFTIGLFELNADGTRKLDRAGNPIPTYDNVDITNLAEVFTGLNYNASNFFNGFRDDGRSGFMTTPMRLFPNFHDFTEKRIPIGVDARGRRLHHTIPARSPSEENGMQDIADTIAQLVRHPNTAPFVCRQLIQFLVTSNPTPEFVARVSSVFVDNGEGEVGDLEAVVKAILLDEEARDPLEHLRVAHFGQFREPLIRLVHLLRIFNMGRHENLLWWDFGTAQEQTLQTPMESPTVFNYYRPDFSLAGNLAENNIQSPVLQIVDSYSIISYNNYLWRICENGIRHPNGSGFYDNQEFSLDFSGLLPLVNDIPALLDHLSLLYCAGTLGAESRNIIGEVLEAEPNRADRIRLAVYLVLIASEGSVLK